MTDAALQPVIVGAGPAGVRAAEALVAHGLRPLVIDEAARAGGQIYRRPPANFIQRTAATLYGFEASRANAVHLAFDALRDRIDYRPDSLVWNAQAGVLDVLHNPTRTTTRVPHGALIVATGATDRVLPVPGWTLPGVYTLGGAQVALKFQGCAIGERVVFMGTGPLLYLVAYQYAKAGAKVAAVLDTARLADQIAATPAMLRQPAVFAKGVYFVAWLRAHGVPLHSGVRPLRVIGDAERAASPASRGTTAAKSARSTATPSASATRCAPKRNWPTCSAAASNSRRCTAPTCRCAMQRAAPASKACTSRAMAPASWAPTRPSGPASAPRSRCSRTAAWPSMPRAPQRSNASSKRSRVSGADWSAPFRCRRTGPRTRPTTSSSAAARTSPPARCARPSPSTAPTR
jgi:hypothetical protein